MALVAAASVLAAGLVATGISGCADMSGITPQATLRDAPSLGLASAAKTPEPLAADWWLAFGDEPLNGLMAQALASSPSLKLAQARLARAQAVTEVADAATRPQLNGQLDLTRQRYSANGAVPPPLAGSIRDSGTAQLSASWELDFFGKNRAALDAALGSVHAAEADAQAARVLLASQVARSYFQLVRLNEQALVARRTLAQREETLKLVQDRVRAGLDTRLELRQSEGGLPEARLQLEAVQEQMVLTRNALGALVGKPNSALAQTPSALEAIKTVAMVPAIPADLLGRRADIAAARWRVEASLKDVANAKTQFYPNINLVAFAGFSSIGLGRLLDAGSQQWGVGPALRLPIFDAGRLRANLRGKTADLDAAVESYNAAVIDAVRDVADQVASSQAITRQQTEQRATQEAAEGAYEIAVQRYKAGLGNYLNVLTAETSVLNQRRLAVDLAARALDTQVALMRALGGGYTPTSTSTSTSTAVSQSL
ncbi:efflux transporter outer membrane subunit [Polaromonas sp.]|uniref:efflux transporter outer membrane subunit n=1 Tax=Polaromonas sp. TaxID=1869339 RepID=UPI00286B5CA6|nr:efflux transporter outer membrane subunit [Polaromonas sp.]